MIKFYKVSFEQYLKDFRNCNPLSTLSDDEIRKIYDNIKLPKRATKGSAGYDIFSPQTFELKEDYLPQTVPLGIKAEMPENVFLMIVPRSGIGFKTGSRLANTVGIIDSDYFNAVTNEGHIMIKFMSGFKDASFVEGKALAQGIFLNYITTDDDEAGENRIGGFGSTSNQQQ